MLTGETDTFILIEVILKLLLSFQCFAILSSIAFLYCFPWPIISKHTLSMAPFYRDDTALAAFQSSGFSALFNDKLQIFVTSSVTPFFSKL